MRSCTCACATVHAFVFVCVCLLQCTVHASVCVRACVSATVCVRATACKRATVRARVSDQQVCVRHSVCNPATRLRLSARTPIVSASSTRPRLGQYSIHASSASSKWADRLLRPAQGSNSVPPPSPPSPGGPSWEVGGGGKGRRGERIQRPRAEILARIGRSNHPNRAARPSPGGLQSSVQWAGLRERIRTQHLLCLSRCASAASSVPSQDARPCAGLTSRWSQ